MQAPDRYVGFLEKTLQPLIDITGLDWITLSLILEIVAFLVLYIIIRVIFGRGSSLKIKLTTPTLGERGAEMSGENLAGLKALLISTSAAMQTLESLKAKKEIGNETYTQLSSRYREQLSKIEGKLTEELNSAERDRLRQRYDESLQITPTDSTTPATTESASSDLITVEPPSGPPSVPSPPSGPPSGPPSVPTTPSASGESGSKSSIADLRNEMLKELGNLRNLLNPD